MLPPINANEVKQPLTSTHTCKIDSGLKNCLETSKKIVDLVATPPSISKDGQTPTPTEKDPQERQNIRSQLQSSTELLAKEFVNNYFAIPLQEDSLIPPKTTRKSSCSLTLNAESKEPKEIISSAMEILFQNLENCSDQSLLADYALILHRSDNQKEFAKVIQKLETLGNVSDVLILKMLATKNLMDPKYVMICNSLRDVKATSKYKLKSQRSAASAYNQTLKSMFSMEELVEIIDRGETQRKIATAQAAKHFKTYNDQTKLPLLKRGFDELIELFCDKYNLFEAAMVVIDDVQPLDLDAETRKRVNLLLPTIQLYSYLRHKKAPLISLNKNMEVVFNIEPDKDNIRLEIAEKLITEDLCKENTYFNMLKTVFALLKGTFQNTVCQVEPNKDSTSQLLNFYKQIFTGTLKQVPPKPLWKSNYQPIIPTKTNILECSFEHHYLYARALAILSFQSSNQVYLEEALDHLNTIIDEKYDCDEKIDEDYYKIRGRIRFQLRYYSDALEDFLTVFKLKPDDPRKVLDVAKVYTKLGKHQESLTFIRTFFVTLPQAKGLTKNLSSLLRQAIINYQGLQVAFDDNQMVRMLKKICKDQNDLSKLYDELSRLIGLGDSLNKQTRSFLLLFILVDPEFKRAKIDLYNLEHKNDLQKLENDVQKFENVLKELEPKVKDTLTIEQENPNVEAEPENNDSPSTESMPQINPEAENRRKELEEQTKIEEEREKARFAQLRREHQKKQKEEKRIATGRVVNIPIQTQPVNLVTTQKAAQEWLPELKVNRKYTVDYLMKEYIPQMIKCTYAELTEEEKEQIQQIELKNEKEPPRLHPPKHFDDRNPEESTPYLKKKIDETPLVISKKKKEPGVLSVDNPDVNRVKSARRYMKDLEDLFNNRDRDYPQNAPINTYAVDRALKYYLKVFGESLCPTQAKSVVLSAGTAKEISTQIMDVAIAHQLGDDVKNWFPLITKTRLNLTCQTLVKFKLHDSLKSWLETKDSTEMTTTFTPTQPLLWSLKGLVQSETKEKWKQLSKEELHERYFTLLIHELESLALIAKFDMVSLAQFQTDGNMYQSAAKMSISIIAKCLTNIGMDLKSFKGLIHFSNLIGQEIGEDGQIRYYEFEETKDVRVLYDLSLNAENLKNTILEILCEG